MCWNFKLWNNITSQISSIKKKSYKPVRSGCIGLSWGIQQYNLQCLGFIFLVKILSFKLNVPYHVASAKWLKCCMVLKSVQRPSFHKKCRIKQIYSLNIDSDLTFKAKKGHYTHTSDYWILVGVYSWDKILFRGNTFAS